MATQPSSKPHYIVSLCMAGFAYRYNGTGTLADYPSITAGLLQKHGIEVISSDNLLKLEADLL